MGAASNNAHHGQPRASHRSHLRRTVEIEIRDVYGVPKAYPVNQVAKTVAEIAGTKTLTAQTIAQAGRLGFDVHVVNNRRISEI